jgi:hypothetical protein
MRAGRGPTSMPRVRHGREGIDIEVGQMIALEVID